MKFPGQIFDTEDPGFFFVQFKGEIEIIAGGKYENDYSCMLDFNHKQYNAE